MRNILITVMMLVVVYIGKTFVNTGLSEPSYLYCSHFDHFVH